MKTQEPFTISVSPLSIAERQFRLSQLKNLNHLLTPGIPGNWEATEFGLRESCFHQTRPFGLSKIMGVRNNIAFTAGGCGKKITTVSINFLTNIHFIVGHESHRQPKALRRIEAPFPDGNPKHHYVFFELINPQGYVISGETTDFGGESFEDMKILEDCFTTLSKIFGVPIESHTVDAVNLDELYKKEHVFAT